jgi:hypothetical protein
MKLYRKKEKLVVTAFVALLVGLLLVSCPDSGGSDNGGLPVIPPGPPPPPPSDISDFTTPGAGALLFGTSMDYLTAAANYSTGDNVIALMNERRVNAGTYGFYPSFDGYNSAGSNSSGPTQVSAVYNGVPLMGFRLNGANLQVFGSGVTSSNQYIRYWVAIIGLDGKGWLSEHYLLCNSYSGGEYFKNDTIPISSLTNKNSQNSNPTTATGLQSGNYVVYIIVKTTSFHGGDGGAQSNMNETGYNVCNVILIPY